MRAARGFSLVEVIISLVIFSAVILALIGLGFQVAKKSTRATDQALIMATLSSKVDRVSMIPFDSLASIVGCDSTYSGTVLVRSCVAIVALTPRLDSVRIDIQTSVPGTKPDTIFLRRVKNPVAIPLR